MVFIAVVVGVGVIDISNIGVGVSVVFVAGVVVGVTVVRMVAIGTAFLGIHNAGALIMNGLGVVSRYRAFAIKATCKRDEGSICYKWARPDSPMGFLNMSVS